MKSIPFLVLTISATFLTGCATTMYGSKHQVPPAAATIPDYKVTFASDSFLGKSGHDKGYKFYWAANPEWSTISKVKRKLGKNVDLQELIERPYYWGRTTTNTPVVSLRKTAGFLNILIMTIPYGEECYMKKFSLSQITYTDATREPAALTENKEALASYELHDGWDSEVKINCDDYDKMTSNLKR